MEEIVRAFNYVIEKGWAFYWGTSEWSVQEIEEAHRMPCRLSAPVFSDITPDVATKLNLIPPITEQMQYKCVLEYFASHTVPIPYSMFHRERPEKEYA